ncbi:MAG: prenyltransferase/squalene oxidase repeat-containing protein [Chloroflexota bacterium]|nr:prenyltransferase/squalene oxidase repeat-containing protein [Chloroflexota bacterium]
MRSRYILLTFFIGLAWIVILLVGVSVQAKFLSDEVPDTPEGTEAFIPSNVDIVVQFQEGDDIVRGIHITEPISGLNALLAADLDVVTEDFGEFGLAVCAINGIGCFPPEEDCFCQSDSWNYRQWMTDTWKDPGQGASFITITIGAIEGWRWGQWNAEETLPPGPRMVSVSNALDWLKLKQNTVTGGYDSMSSSVEVLLAAGSNQHRAADWRQTFYTVPLSKYFITGNRSAPYSNKTVAESGKLTAGFPAADLCMPALTKTPADYYSPTLGTYSNHSGFNTWGMLGTQSMSETLPLTAITQLKDSVMQDGGWEWNQGFGSDTNTTALVIQTLVAAGEPPTTTLILNALDYLKAAQNDDGGFPYNPDSQYGTDSDTNSTAYVTQAIYTVGQNPITGTWVISGTNPIEFIQSMQLENGSFEWMPGYGENLLATTQSIPALLGLPFPLQQRIVEYCPTTFMPLVYSAIVEE